MNKVLSGVSYAKAAALLDALDGFVYKGVHIARLLYLDCRLQDVRK